MTAALGAVVARLPGTPGVYRFRDARGRVLYLGRATHLRQRVGSYWTDLRDRRHLTRMVPQVARIEAVACDSVHEAAWLERNLLERAKPRWNRTRGVESPVCIVLEHRTGAPRLRVAHWPVVETPGRPAPAVETFGPYLGGTRARLAVSALDRVLPLRYTADRLGGCDRDLARVRGVDATDRDRLLAAVTAVLRRQPAEVETVREQLAQHRDVASTNLAFELADRIQQEIEALDWVVAEQKVTQLTRPPEDCAAYGWADGLLVCFRIRGGRLCGWEQRASSRQHARPQLDRTPPAWTPFATRAAELGSRLARQG